MLFFTTTSNNNKIIKSNKGFKGIQNILFYYEQMVFHHTSRVIYDYDFIKASCPEEDYFSLLNVDDSFGTYSTNFLITFVCLFFAMKIIVTKSQTNHLAYYFIGIGLTMLVAGITHLFQKSVFGDSLAEKVIDGLPKLFNGLSCLPMVLLGLKVYRVDRFSQFPLNLVWWFKSLITVILVITLVVTGRSMVLLFFILLIHVGVMCVFVQQMCCTRSNNGEIDSKKHYGLKGFGIFNILFGYAVQVLLAPTCGTVGYKDCFEKCPLPAPYFNHNALFHVFYVFGVFVLGWSEIQHPTVDVQKETYIEILDQEDRFVEHNS